MVGPGVLVASQIYGAAQRWVQTPAQPLLSCEPPQTKLHLPKMETVVFDAQGNPAGPEGANHPHRN